MIFFLKTSLFLLYLGVSLVSMTVHHASAVAVEAEGVRSFGTGVVDSGCSVLSLGPPEEAESATNHWPSLQSLLFVASCLTSFLFCVCSCACGEVYMHICLHMGLCM